MIFFTTLAGAAQGLLLALVGIDFAFAFGRLQAPTALFLWGAGVILVMSAVGLLAAMFHLGHPLRAWRAVAMWRTSWLSREVIVMPIFMALVFAWGVAHALHWPALILGACAAALALMLYLCTGMIYAAVKAIRQWAHPITPTNYLLIGVASGLMLATVMAAVLLPAWVWALGSLALVATLLAGAARGWALWRNLNLVPKTTLQSAIGVRHPRIAQKSQGAMGGSFNTREFFHHRSPGFVWRVRWAAGILGFGLPALGLALGASSVAVLAAIWVAQYLGLLAERWSFFAEGMHPQNLYYQSVS